MNSDDFVAYLNGLVDNHEKTIINYQQQFKEKDEEINNLKSVIKYKEDYIFTKEDVDRIEWGYKQQLKEKDEEIEMYKSNAIIDMQNIEISQLALLTNTHQVCEKTREAINECDFIVKDGFYYIKQIELNDKVDQIEKGKTDEK